MKLSIGGYEIEIKAKGAGDERNTKEWAMYFLNELSMAYTEAAKAIGQNGANAISEDFEEKGMQVYRALKSAGFYDR